MSGWEDQKALSIAVSLFHHARDRWPKVTALRLSDLAELVAPDDPPIRADLYHRCQQELLAVDAALDAFEAHEPAPPSARGWLNDLNEAAAKAQAEGDTWEGQFGAAATRADSLRRERKQEAKSQLSCWSPTDYPDDARRRDADVRALSCLTYDYDGGIGIDEALVPWTAYARIVATTWSHTLAHPKFRLVLPLAEPIAARHWRRAWRWGFERGGKLADSQCVNQSRLYYLPARQHHHAAYESRRYLDWPLLRVPAEALIPPKVVQPPRPRMPRPPVSCRPSRRLYVARERLKSDPATRERAAERLLADILRSPDGDRAEAIPCPGCGRSSAWFYIAPTQLHTAQCSHKNSCGWWGFLDLLLGEQGVLDVG